MENQTTKQSKAELKALLAAIEEDEKKALAAEETAYIKEKDVTIAELMSEASELALWIGAYKEKVHAAMEKQAVKLAEYGKIRGNSKGGFSITNSSENLRIIRRRDTEPVWDERATKGVALIKEFLGTTIKKRDVKIYEILIGFLERNENGDLEFSKVMELLQHEEKFESQHWKEGLRLIKEGYSISLKSFGYEFKQKSDDGKWLPLVLNFSSL